MLQYVFYALVASTVCLAFVNWRTAVYAWIILEILRDPVRKLTLGHPVMITLSASLVLPALAAAILFQEREGMAQISRQLGRLSSTAAILVLALVPGAIVSMISYPGGWMLALFGGASYLAVIPGVLIGVAFARRETDVTRFLAFYCIANAIAMVGGVLEYLQLPVPALGGIDIDWVRFRTGYSVALISGFYRSPDLLGLHAANVCMFACVLGARPKSKARWVWWLIVIGAAVLLVLSGRRKMIGIPFVFGASYVLFQMLYFRRARWADWSMLSATAVMFMVLTFSGQFGISVEHRSYASTLTSEGADRLATSVVRSPLGTIGQSGLFGLGLGTATQGVYHLVGTSMTWQEDGTGRLVAELGLLGVGFFVVAAVLLLRHLRRILLEAASQETVFRLKAGLLSVVVGNIASFVISHQAYSGDPSSICFVMFCLGLAIGLPAHAFRWVVAAPGAVRMAADARMYPLRGYDPKTC